MSAVSTDTTSAAGGRVMEDFNARVAARTARINNLPPRENAMESPVYRPGCLVIPESAERIRGVMLAKGAEAAGQGQLTVGLDMDEGSHASDSSSSDDGDDGEASGARTLSIAELKALAAATAWDLPTDSFVATATPLYFPLRDSSYDTEPFHHPMDPRGGSAQLSRIAELQFVLVGEASGWRVYKTCSSADMSRHVDFVVQKTQYSPEGTPTHQVNLKVDVKALKRISKDDAAPQNKYLWIETCGLRSYQSWLDGSNASADIIAVQVHDNTFALLDRRRLATYVTSLGVRPLSSRIQDAMARFSFFRESRSHTQERMVLEDFAEAYRAAGVGMWSTHPNWTV